MGFGMRGLIIFALVLMLGKATYGAEIDLNKPVYDLLDDNKGSFNKFAEEGGIPSQFSFLTSARINLYVDNEIVGIVMEGGRITELVKGGLNDPTNEFKTSRGYFNSILISENPLKRINFGLKNAYIMKRDFGVGGKSKGKLLEGAIDKLDVPEPKVEKKVSKSLDEIGEKQGEVFVVEGEKAGLKKIDFELKTSEEAGSKNVNIEEYTGYVDDSPPGINKLALGQGEGTLGAYIKIEAPDIKVDEFVLKISYSDEELDYKFLDEGSLSIKYLDEGTGQWLELKAGSPDWVKEIGVNKEGNYVYAKLAHASVYGVSGTILELKKLEEQRGIQPVYFESPAEIEKVRAGATSRGIIDRIIAFILGLFLK